MSWLFWRKKNKSSLAEGAEKLDAVLRGLQESQRAFKDAKPADSRVFSPTEAWSKKYLSQGIGPDTALAQPIACFDDGTCLPPRSQWMGELSARAEDCHCNETKAAPASTTLADIGKTPMNHPFNPEKYKRKRSWFG